MSHKYIEPRIAATENDLVAIIYEYIVVRKSAAAIRGSMRVWDYHGLTPVAVCFRRYSRLLGDGLTPKSRE